MLVDSVSVLMEEPLYNYKLIEDVDTWQLAQLVQSVAPDFQVDWDLGVYPFWIGGYKRGGLYGALLVQPAKPFGRLEYLCIDPLVNKKQRATLTKQLIYNGLDYLKRIGSQVVLTSIDIDWPQEWHDVLCNRGAMKIATCHTYARRV